MYVSMQSFFLQCTLIVNGLQCIMVLSTVLIYVEMLDVRYDTGINTIYSCSLPCCYCWSSYLFGFTTAFCVWTEGMKPDGYVPDILIRGLSVKVAREGQIDIF